MIQLSREIRFALTPPTSDQIGNSWAGWPSTNRVVPRMNLRCILEGNPDPQTGYVCNIKRLDELLRQIVLDTLIPNATPETTAEQMVGMVWEQAKHLWDIPLPIINIDLELTPFLTYSISGETENMVTLTQQFEFSAAHRLHCDDLGDAENRELFGKCNNPSGHGHNYVFEVAVSGAVQDESGTLISPDTFERIVKDKVVDRLDHKHLNQDVDYFKTTIPSVENIAIAIFNWLDGQLEGTELKSVKVYETPKTWAKYSG